MTADYWLEIARGTIEAAEYCFLITQGESDWANVRLMQPFKPKEDLTIWFGANPKSRKVREIGQNDQVAVSYENPREHAYVTLLGHARTESNVNERRKYWRQEWARFWPQGPESNDYVLIKFVPSRIELMNISRNVAPDARTKPAVLVRVDEGWVIEDDVNSNQSSQDL
jgi:general stress protein 26